MSPSPWLTRPWARRRCGDSNELANYYIAAVGVFYALLVGLIAVATWEALLTVALSAVIGLSIFLIFALDGPLVGDDAVQPKIFQDVMSTMNP